MFDRALNMAASFRICLVNNNSYVATACWKSSLKDNKDYSLKLLYMVSKSELRTSDQGC